MQQHFYRLESSTNLINWKNEFWFVSEGNLSEPITVPPNMLRQFNSMFFRIIYGHQFNANLGVNLFASAGAINANPPYNVTVNYPVSISSYNLRFTAQFDPSYAAMNEVIVTGPSGSGINGIQASQMGLRAADYDPGAVAYGWHFSGVPVTGLYTVNYKGTNSVFNVDASYLVSHLIVPAPSLTVQYGMLTAISWTYRNPSNGNIYASMPSFLEDIDIEIDDHNGNRIYENEIDDPSIRSHTLSSPIPFSNIRSIYLCYDDYADNHYVISFQK